VPGAQGMSGRQTVRIATRGSALALAQARLVAAMIESLEASPVTELVVVRGSGDIDASSSLQNIGGAGVFTAEIDSAVLDSRADCAVHSMKDLPSATAPGLDLAAVPPRASAFDCIAPFEGAGIEDIPGGATVATGSPRRISQLRQARPDLKILGIRGNVETRLDKARDSGWAGAVLAEAGLKRLGLDHIPRLSLSGVMVPAAGQGALAVTTREDSAALRELLGQLDDAESHACVDAERAFMRHVGAGCHAPAGAHARITESGQIRLSCALFAIDGSTSIQVEMTGDLGEGPSLGRQAASSMLAKGGRGLLEESAPRPRPPGRGGAN